MPLDPADLTKRQRRVYRGLQTGMTQAEMAVRFKMGHGNIKSAIDQIADLEIRGRKTVLEATTRAAEIDAKLAAQPMCGRCGLRGPHVCTSVLQIAGTSGAGW